MGDDKADLHIAGMQSNHNHILALFLHQLRKMIEEVPLMFIAEGKNNADILDL